MEDGIQGPAHSADLPMTREQKRTLVAAWLGWAFDGLDGYLYILVATPFVAQLLDKPMADPEVGKKAALIQATFLVGWAVGGAVFGRIGDRLGRSRTLTLTVLTYALFTGLTFFSTEWWHLLVFRFIAALGIGGEWAAGSALVSEVLPKKHRAWASATLQSGYMVGMLLAIATTQFLKGFEPRYVFLVGVAPALLTVWIRYAVPEPREWREAAARAPMPKVSSLFRGSLAVRTLLTFGLASVALTTVWAFLFFVPQMVRAMPEMASATPQERTTMVTRVTVVFTLVNIAANFVATYLAKRIGYRKTFVLMFVGAGASFMLGFREAPTTTSIYWVTSAAALCSLGVFGLFPLYIPPLFPTLVRTLGAGLTYNTGRLIAAAGTFVAGSLAAEAGGPHRAIFWLGLLYIPGIVIAMFMPEGDSDAVRE
jgi:MFS family permease